ATREGFDRNTWLFRAVGESYSAGEYAAATRRLKRIGMQVSEHVASYHAWLTPTLGKPPLEIGELYAKGAQVKLEELIARMQAGRFVRRSGELERISDRVFAFMPFT